MPQVLHVASSATFFSVSVARRRIGRFEPCCTERTRCTAPCSIAAPRVLHLDALELQSLGPEDQVWDVMRNSANLLDSWRSWM